MKIVRFQILFCCFAITMLCHCGTRDYGSSPEAPTSEERPPEPPSQTRSETTNPMQEGVNAACTGDCNEDGYVWGGISAIGVSDQKIREVQANLKDPEVANFFDALGTSMAGGAAVAALIRVFDSWLLVGPAETSNSAWFWSRIKQFIAGSGLGLVRGGLVGGLSYFLLTGFDSYFYKGLLGQDFQILSSAVTVGTMAIVPAADLIMKIFRANWTDSKVVGDWISKSRRATSFVTSFESWSQASKLGSAVRFRFLPGVSIVAVVLGVGLIVYEILQPDEPDPQ